MVRVPSYHPMPAALDTLLTRALESEELEADPTAQRILDAAVELYQDFGLRRTSMDDVAKRAGVGRMTLYRRFPQKDVLVEAVLMRETRQVLVALEAATSDIDPIEERAVEAFALGMAMARRHPLTTRLLAIEPEAVLPHVTTEGGPFLRALRDFIAAQVGDLETAEVLARLGISFLITPETIIPLGDDRQARAFARRHIAPIVRAAQ